MTNLSSSNKEKNLITPESSLLFIPITIGILILTSLLVFIYRPLLKKQTNEEAQITVLKDKISYIPTYQKYINEVEINTAKAQNQQERLIAIISDPQQLDTILSEINRISIKNEIEIINVAPQPIIKYPQSKDKDPFLIPSIEKHIFKLSLKGEFNKLLDFLKDMELLQSISISDNIAIKVIQNNSNKKNIKLLLNFDLITYAKVGSNSKILSNEISKY